VSKCGCLGIKLKLGLLLISSRGARRSAFSAKYAGLIRRSANALGRPRELKSTPNANSKPCETSYWTTAASPVGGFGGLPPDEYSYPPAFHAPVTALATACCEGQTIVWLVAL
jgi:hypothetical protein